MMDATVHELPDRLNRTIDELAAEMDAIDVVNDPAGAERMADCLTRLQALTTANVNRMHALGHELKGDGE